MKHALDAEIGGLELHAFEAVNGELAQRFRGQSLLPETADTT